MTPHVVRADGEEEGPLDAVPAEDPAQGGHAETGATERVHVDPETQGSGHAPFRIRGARSRAGRIERVADGPAPGPARR